VARTAAVEENTRGVENRNVAVEQHGVTKALANRVGVAIAQAKLPVLMRVRTTGKCLGAEGEVFVCLGQTRKRVYESVKSSKVEAVEKAGA
jgi:hypothetical protein